jgi:hypothetical protein
MSYPDPHGQVALLLYESLVHLLVEEGVLSKERAIEAIEGVAELTCEMAEAEPVSGPSRAAAALVETIAASFRLKV